MARVGVPEGIKFGGDGSWSYQDEIELSKEDWKPYEDEIKAKGKGPAPTVFELVQYRISRKRAKGKATDLVESGVAIIDSVPKLFAWTYGSVTVDGAHPEGVRGLKVPKVDMTKAQFNALKLTKDEAKAIQNPEGADKEVLESAQEKASKMAALIGEHQTDKRACYAVWALILNRIWKPTAEDLVYLCAGRLSIEGVVMPAVASTRGVDLADFI